MMTRNDFELLANKLRSERAQLGLGDISNDRLRYRAQGFYAAVNCVAEVCKANNARFQGAKFFAACGIGGVDRFRP